MNDDDCSMRSLLQHNDHGGRLPSKIEEPKCLVDPGHRIKFMAKPIFGLAYLPLKSSTCRKVHTL